jgi:SAM domain (Sterile alpha motif)
MEQIAEWLANLGMSEYAERFAENRIDFAVLPDLTDQDLKDIGVVLGDRRKILRAIARLDAAPEAVALEPKAPVTFSAAVQGLPVESRERRDLTPDEIVGDAGGGPPRANYYRLVARAVNGLESTSEARQVIYERARKALIAHLRFNQPALSKAAMVKERLALEDAIREIEAGAARKSRREIPAESQPATPSAGIPDGGAASELLQRNEARPATADMPEGGWPAVLLDAREQLLSGRSSLERRSVKGFRDIVREVHDFGTVPPRALQAAPPTREAYEEKAIEPILDRHDLYWFELDTPQQRDREDAYAPDDGRLIALPQVRATRGTAPEAERSLSYGALAHFSWR